MDNTINLTLDPAFVQRIEGYETRLARLEAMQEATTGAIGALGTLAGSGIGLRNDLEAKVTRLEEDLKEALRRTSELQARLIAIESRVEFMEPGGEE